MKSTRVSSLIIAPRLISIATPYCRIIKIDMFFGDLERSKGGVMNKDI
jgi:hypothetical protein